jgi:hypothetical protein
MLKYSTSHEDGGSISIQAKGSADEKDSYFFRSNKLSPADRAVPKVKAEPKFPLSTILPNGAPGSVKPLLRRRNSTGTIYVDSTMSKQDNTHTIDCICVVIRAHMVEAAKDNIGINLIADYLFSFLKFPRITSLHRT